LEGPLVNWLAFFGLLWAGILAGVAVFVVVDARNAYDGDPATATLSGYIKRWRRLRKARSWLLTIVCLLLVLVPVYLYCHLVQEWI
jgi:hypothetical protein